MRLRPEYGRSILEGVLRDPRRLDLPVVGRCERPYERTKNKATANIK